MVSYRIVFGNGVIIPLVKDKQGDLCNIDNYLGITLSPFLAKRFGHCILDKYDHLMLSNYLQFDFKKHSSCSQPFCVRASCRILCDSW